MNHDVAFLHTASVHIPTFQRIVDTIDPSVKVRHDVCENLLSEALAHGITAKLAGEIDNAMAAASHTGAKVVVCTCSTIGGVAENSPQTDSTVSMRIDRAMADLAVETSDNILIVAAVESTLKPTRELLQASSANAGKSPSLSLELIPGAWPFFEMGKMDEYYECIEKYIRQQHAAYDSVVLAQASMAPTANRFVDSAIRVLASPELGVRSAIEQIRAIPVM